MLHAKDKSPVKFERVCIRDGHPVAWEDLVKGFEYAKGHFVVLTKEDFQAAAVEKTRAVDIVDFVKAEEIDDRYFETPYYLVPVKGGERAYALLREAIRESGRIGIAKFILRDAQHLAGVEVIDQALVLSVMRFADELADPKPLGEIHRPVPREPDADHQGQGQGQEGDARGAGHAAPGRGGRPDGTAAAQSRSSGREVEAGEAAGGE
jgi:DNA end-binding protein Ku